MVVKKAEAGAAETKREVIIALVEEVAVVKEAEEATSTTTMQEEAVAVSMKAEAALVITYVITKTTHTVTFPATNAYNYLFV